MSVDSSHAVELGGYVANEDRPMDGDCSLSLMSGTGSERPHDHRCSYSRHQYCASLPTDLGNCKFAVLAPLFNKKKVHLIGNEEAARFRWNAPCLAGVKNLFRSYWSFFKKGPLWLKKDFSSYTSFIFPFLLRKWTVSIGFLILAVFLILVTFHSFDKPLLSALTPSSDLYSMDNLGSHMYETARDVRARQKCAIAVITTYPPEECGIAQFSYQLVNAIRDIENSRSSLEDVCSVSVLALNDHTGTVLLRNFDSSVVKYIIDLDDDIPSKAVYAAVEYLHSHQFTHVLLQQEFGLTPIMWQQLDLMRWIRPEIYKMIVVHTPRAYPNNEERHFIRHMSRCVDKLIVMSYYAKYSLIDAYHVDPTKIAVVPHGVLDLNLNFSRYERFDVNTTIPSFALNGPSHQSTINSTISLKKENETLIILSNGLIHPFKGYQRIIRNLPRIVDFFPQVQFVIIGRVHSKNKDTVVMNRYLELAKELCVENHVVWINQYVSDVELLEYFRIADIYVTMYDEITPVSGALTTAMAAGLAILSTPYRFACEMIGTDHGVLLPLFDDDDTIVESIVTLLGSKTLQVQLGLNASKRVRSWRWSTIAQVYLSYLRSSLSTPPPPPLPIQGSLLNDSLLGFIFENDPYAHFHNKVEKQAFWKGSVAQGFDDSILLDASDLSSALSNGVFTLMRNYSEKVLQVEKHGKMTSFLRRMFLGNSSKMHNFIGSSKSIIICLFADGDIQVNGVIEPDFSLVSVGIRTPIGWVYSHRDYGIDYERLPKPTALSEATILDEHAKNDSMYHISVDLERNTARIKTKNVLVDTQIVDKEVSVSLTLSNCFSHPVGFLGETARSYYDASVREEFVSNHKTRNANGLYFGNPDWSGWIISDDFLFSIQSKNQTWSMFGVQANVYDLPKGHGFVHESIPFYPSYQSTADLKSLLKIKTPQTTTRDDEDEAVSRFKQAFCTPAALKAFSKKPAILVQFEGPFFDHQGFATVNRKLFLQLLSYRSHILTRVIPTDLFTTATQYPFSSSSSSSFTLDSVLKVLVFYHYLNPFQLPDETHLFYPDEMSFFEQWQNSISLFYSQEVNKLFPADIVFRNAWLEKGPDLSCPSNPKSFWIQQLPWEFSGLPKSWLHALKDVDQVWVPSVFCKESFVANGLDPSNIKVIPHGITLEKFDLSSDHFSIATNKRFKFLYSGGLLSRKGIDILVQAYRQAFRQNDNVCLVIHFAYGDGWYLDELRQYIRDYNMACQYPNLILSDPERYDLPEIVLLENLKLDWKDVIRLYKNCNVYVSPYRSEGFGLMILEAMASGLPVIVPSSGPALEITCNECAFYIECDPPSVCLVPPCSKGSIFGLETEIDPTWSVPKINSLVDILQQVEASPELVQQKGIAAKRVASSAAASWDDVGSHVVDQFVRVLALNSVPQRSR